jgi:hypothetical protein
LLSTAQVCDFVTQVSQSSLIEINRGINAFRSARDNATAGRGDGPSRRSPRRAAPNTAAYSVARRVDELPPSVRVPVFGRVGRVQASAASAWNAAPAARTNSAPAASNGSPAPASTTGIPALAVSTGRSAPAPRAGSAETTSSVRGAVSARDIQGRGMTAAGRGVASAGVAGRFGSGRGSAERMAPRGTSERPIPAGLPPSAARPVRPTPMTTSRTGLTEVQLREISSIIKRSNTPSFSETVNKRRRLDVAIDDACSLSH